jgi:hypothetical protein
MALLYVWLIVSAITAAVAISPLVADAAFLQSIVPLCEARSRGSSCAACGMTTAFIHIAAGRWSDAHSSNASAIPLWAGWLTNSVIALLYLTAKLFGGKEKCKC